MAEERILDARETGLMVFVVCYMSSAAPQAKWHVFISSIKVQGADVKADICVRVRIWEM
jgi:hypothetical protein